MPRSRTRSPWVRSNTLLPSAAGRVPGGDSARDDSAEEAARAPADRPRLAQTVDPRGLVPEAQQDRLGVAALGGRLAGRAGGFAELRPDAEAQLRAGRGLAPSDGAARGVVLMSCDLGGGKDGRDADIVRLEGLDPLVTWPRGEALDQRRPQFGVRASSNCAPRNCSRSMPRQRLAKKCGSRQATAIQPSSAQR